MDFDFVWHLTVEKCHLPGMAFVPREHLASSPKHWHHPITDPLLWKAMLTTYCGVHCKVEKYWKYQYISYNIYKIMYRLKMGMYVQFLVPWMYSYLTVLTIEVQILSNVLNGWIRGGHLAVHTYVEIQEGEHSQPVNYQTKSTSPQNIETSRGEALSIPDICHFFTRAKFLEHKIYTKKMRKLRENTL